MYSREESQKIKREFWVAFAEKHPRKWVLYDTKIKDFSFKFFVDNKKAQVLIDIEHRSDEKRNAYFEKIEALKKYFGRRICFRFGLREKLHVRKR